jgi:cysteine desulfurase family protein (TIGR01976 family)
MTNFTELVPNLRAQFPALARRVGDHPAAFFDGPAGTQVPLTVIDTVSDYYRNHNANHGGLFATSQESDVVLDEAHQAVADFLGASDPDTVCFGANMTSLTFALSRALGRTWQTGDEILVSRLDHDANFTPWVLAAQDAGATVRYADIKTSDCTLDINDLKSKINSKTKLVAVGVASNAVGSLNPVKEICGWAQDAGALSFIDAVHSAPHQMIDVEDIGCDFLACSAYKFFGPHVGILFGKRTLLESTQPYKLRPSADTLPDRWMTGTQNHECISGTRAAIDYLANIGRDLANDHTLNRRAALTSAFSAIQEYEGTLIWQLLDALSETNAYRVYGITDRTRSAERLPTISITHESLTPEELTTKLGQLGFFVWHGNYYAQPLTEALGVEPEGMVRIGIAHYNTEQEVQRLIDALRTMQ